MLTSLQIEKEIEGFINSQNFKGEPAELYDPIEYIISIGGKRIRPRLCLTTYNLFNNQIDDNILYPATAFEVFHAFTLIHDDIMDKADMRRGHPTVHKKWGDNIAILSGDVMSILSFALLSRTPLGKHGAVFSSFYNTATQVCEGQQFDMNYENVPYISTEQYISMIGLKTAVLIACAAKVGAIIGGADEKTSQALYDYGYQLGIAFQITDDYLDVYGDSSVFGKNIGGDIVNNKKSWLLVETANRATGESLITLEKTMSLTEEQSEEKIVAMRRLYKELGVKEGAEKEIERYYHSAMAAVENINLNEEQINSLKVFARMITYRNK